ncbi:MAG: 5-dehydro-2-deoxygluconokinase [Rudaea sp.]|uniref:bifunctional 5-dehydro-2-deoxygluconokinase/5-dehydro-2- deoxyphosphogluconate aldolase n=1 Tax=unclassified Rudaea TaxID=2627037 RepID=UPI0010F48258|nr:MULTISPECIES: 5-dehydro-2-deoxygluconokinase [unclassified Rudaea]MBN8887927.1 5-dehydro-2-deoxygluconokinase [Rudaea sp.]
MTDRISAAVARPLDAIFLGRVAVDLYAQQIGARLEDATSFARYLGGSSGNAAFGSARLGLKSSMLSRVGNDQMGRFLVETLAREGCDTSQLHVDPDRLTAFVLLGIKDRDTFPLLFHRENCADMALSTDDIVEAHIASARALAITGTHLSTPGTLAACLKALDLARKHGLRRVLDIDYRPVLWGLAPRSDGATRFVANAAVTDHLRDVLARFDLIVGTEEEFRIAGGADDLIDALRNVRAASDALLVIKRGALGCNAIDAEIPARIEEAPLVAAPKVDVLNVLGAGDAFMAGFLYGWLRDQPIETCCAYANACGAIVVSRHGCAPAMPSRAELEYFLRQTGKIEGDARELRFTPNAQKARAYDIATDAELAHLHRVSVARPHWEDLHVFAFDHRSALEETARRHGADAAARLPVLKNLLLRATEQTEAALDLAGHIGVLIDDRHGQDALNAASGRRWWIGRPAELPDTTPLAFEHGASIGTQLVTWPQEHTIKCLIVFDPDDATLRAEQERQLRTLYAAACASGHELLIEVIAPAHAPAAQRGDLVLRAIERIYAAGIKPEWWKLAPLAAADWPALDALITHSDPWCRGVLLLGADAPYPELAAGFAAAAGSATCRGFAVGRSVFAEPARAWFAGEIDDDALVARVHANQCELAALWRAARDNVAGPAPVETKRNFGHGLHG